jgi:hypothetical protein
VGGVFLRRGDELVEMTEQPYALEDHLQELIERHPNLLAGDQVDPDAPRRWMLLSREAGVPGEEGGGDRWSLDHLLLDQDAIPTLVEVKRSSDSRIRREVVGQMLDYAANAVTYWNLDVLRAAYEEAASARGRAPEAEIAELVGEPDVEYVEFWERAKTNLQAGRIRLVFVADSIPTELQRVVEFLNERMSPTDVIAVEIRQYTGGSGEQVLVPRVLGQTAQARQKNARAGGRGPRDWDQPSFLQETERLAGQAAAEAAAAILAWAQSRFLRLRFGHGEESGVTLELERGGVTYAPIRVWSSGTLVLLLHWLSRRSPFDQEPKQSEFVAKLDAIPGVALDRDASRKNPAMPLTVFADEPSRAQLFEALEWFIAEVEAAVP